ncbi:hypothetical protein M501DRAFT_919101, partial [Patellaria atrata CBS 101060]
DRPNPNINGFSAALSCYPIVSQLASLLDLNSLHDLSRTCRQFRVNLLQYRRQLIASSLRCSNEALDRNQLLASRLLDARDAWHNHSGNGLNTRLSSGKVGKCARDMVGECRRCGKIVCRNCTAKPPAPAHLKERHRRLCRTCVRAPLASLMVQPLDLEHAHSAFDADVNERGQSLDSLIDPPSFTSPAFARTPCSCPDLTWLCQTCGSSLRSADTTYSRGWNWRICYTQHHGGLGTGIGEGNEGVECGRGASCLAAKEVEHEIEISASDFELEVQGPESVKGARWAGGSYFIQEIEGIGGKVKRKVKKRVRVGAVVKIYEDEKGKSLGREKEGRLRSWCGWCQRVVPSKMDLEDGG